MAKAIPILAGLAVALAPVPALAMIPRDIQRRGDLRAVLALPAVAERRVPIDRIEWLGPSLYRVTAGACHIDVRMIPVRGGASGLTPPRYAPQAGRWICPR